MTNCILCGGRIGARGWVWLNLYEPNANAAYMGGYVCKKCQRKYGLEKRGDDHEEEAQRG